MRRVRRFVLGRSADSQHSLQALRGHLSVSVASTVEKEMLTNMNAGPAQAITIESEPREDGSRRTTRYGQPPSYPTPPSVI